MTYGLIEEFINTEIRNYHEPQRQGTPKGDPIGFSMVKYRATLFALVNNDLKEVAKALNISYGLLRKWRTETEFKKAVNRHCEKFTIKFFRHLLEVNAEEEKQRQEFLKKPLEVIATSQPPESQNRFNRVSNYYSYSYVLDNKISQMATNIYKGKADYLMKLGIIHKKEEMDSLILMTSAFTLWINDIRRSILGIPQTADELKEDMKMLKKANKCIAKMLREIIMKPKITEEDRKQAIYILSLF